MNFSEQARSKEWAALKYRGKRIADVWFKPEGEPFALTFRIPRQSFQVPGMGQRLTAENFLKAVGIATEEVHGVVHHTFVVFEVEGKEVLFDLNNQRSTLTFLPS